MAMSSDEARVPMTRIPYRDLRVRDPLLKMELLEAVGRVLDHGRLVRGPEHEQFEAEMARHCRRQHAVGVGSGTDALYLALRALDIGPGDEVMTTALSCRDGKCHRTDRRDARLRRHRRRSQHRRRVD